MATTLEDYHIAAQEILRDFIGKFETEPPPSTIYHYTDDRGLRGILESGKLWFTDIFDLNDPSELRHGFSFAVNAIDGRAQLTGTQPAATLANYFKNFHVDGGIEQSAHFFVCCFSRDGDELGQWRAYADDGRGFALGFDGGDLENGFTKKDGKPIPQHSTFPITYDDDQLAAVQDKLASEIFRMVTDSTAFDNEWPVYHSVNAIGATIFFKHPAYRTEQEFRFLQLFRMDRPPQVQFRQRPYSLVRFREFDWRATSPNALKEIVVGPAARIDAAQFAADCIAAFHPGKKVNIRRSTVPYRGR